MLAKLTRLVPRFSEVIRGPTYLGRPLDLPLHEKQQMHIFVEECRHVHYREVVDQNLNFMKTLKQHFNPNWSDTQSQHLSGFYNFINENVLKGDNAELNERSFYMFGREGKLVRPLLNLMFHAIITGNEKVAKEQLKWAAVVEVLHVASLVHDDILDNSDERRGQPSLHVVYNKLEATFTGNYMIGRAGRVIAQFEDIEMFRIYSTIMENLTNGEYLQAMKQQNVLDYKKSLNGYVLKSYYKTASMIAISMLGVCKLNKVPIENALEIFAIGLHLGIAFQIVDDVLDYTSSSEQLGKTNMNDLKQGVITGPVLFELYNLEKDNRSQELFRRVISRNDTDPASVREVNNIVLTGQGIERSKHLAYKHANLALQILEKYRHGSKEQENIKSLIYYILSRNK